MWPRIEGIVQFTKKEALGDVKQELKVLYLYIYKKQNNRGCEPRVEGIVFIYI